MESSIVNFAKNSQFWNPLILIFQLIEKSELNYSVHSVKIMIKTDLKNNCSSTSYKELSFLPIAIENTILIKKLLLRFLLPSSGKKLKKNYSIIYLLQSIHLTVTNVTINLSTHNSLTHKSRFCYSNQSCCSINSAIMSLFLLSEQSTLRHDLGFNISKENIIIQSGLIVTTSI